MLAGQMKYIIMEEKMEEKYIGGERIRCNVELSFTNTRLNSQIPGATWISQNG